MTDENLKQKISEMKPPREYANGYTSGYNSGKWDAYKLFEETRAQEPTGDAVEALKKSTLLNLSDAHRFHNGGWNACLDELTKRGLLQTPAAGNAIAWEYELAKSIQHHSDGSMTYSRFEKCLSFEKPNVPDGSIKNLTPLYAAAPSTNKEETK